MAPQGIDLTERWSTLYVALTLDLPDDVVAYARNALSKAMICLRAATRDEHDAEYVRERYCKYQKANEHAVDSLRKMLDSL